MSACATLKGFQCQWVVVVSTNMMQLTRCMVSYVVGMPVICIAN